VVARVSARRAVALGTGGYAVVVPATETTAPHDSPAPRRPTPAPAPVTAPALTAVTDPRMSVVVATMDRREQLARSVPRHEGTLIVVDNGSTDGSPDAVLAARPDADVVRLDHNAGAVARNLGVRRARSPYVAFADDDSWWAPGALRSAADVMDAHPRLAVLAARVLVGPQERVDPFSELLAASPLGREADLPGPSILGFLACGAVVRRDAFLAVGGFDRVIGFLGEEERVSLDLAAAGWGLAYVDAVTVHHHPLPTGRDPRARRRLQQRNALLTAWMRRPLPVALARTAGCVRHGGPDGRAAAAAAARRLPRALARRRVVPAHVEAAIARLEQPAS